MARTEIRGGQIKDDSITGDDVDESTLVLDTLRDADGDTKVQVEESADGDKIRFDTAGVERMIITETGAVGIGTSSPDNTLHVESPGTTHIKIASEAGHEAALKLKSGNEASAYVWQPGDSSDLRFYVNGADRIHIDSTGNVGVGTTGPDRKLDILDASNPQLRLTHTDGSKYVELKATAAGDLEITPSNVNGHVKVSSANNATMLIQSDDGGDSDAQIGFSVNAGSSVQWSLGCDDSDGDKFKIGTSLIETGTCITIDSTGNIGVGTTVPGSGFEVKNSFSLRVAGPKTSNYQLASDDICVTGDCNAGSITLTLPAATDAMTGRIYTVKRLDTGNSGGGNTLTVDRNSKLIDGVASDQVMGNKDALVFQCIGASAGWILIGSYMVPL